MKKILVTISLVIICNMNYATVFYAGPTIDYKGTPTPNGKSLRSRFASLPFNNFIAINRASWQGYLFEQHNRKMIEWEIEKALKLKIFKLNFFKHYLVTSNYCAGYFAHNPAVNTNMFKLITYYSRSKDRNLMEHSEITFYMLAMVGDKNGKLLRQHPEYYRLQSEQQALLKKYNTTFAVNKKIDPKLLQQKNYDNCMQKFKQTKGSFFGYNYFNKLWFKDFDREKIINDMLQQQAVTVANTAIFIKLLLSLERVSDKMATRIIKYFKLDSQVTARNPILIPMTGLNPILTAALKAHWQEFKTRPHKASYYLNAYRLAYKQPGVKIEFSPRFFYIYAAVIGDFNLAFQNFIKFQKKAVEQKMQAAKKAWPYLHAKATGQPYRIVPEQYTKWPVALTFLTGNSNLNETNAQMIISKNYNKFPPPDLRLQQRFAKLVPPKPNFAYLAMQFNFAKLQPNTKKMLVNYIFSHIERLQRKQQQAMLDYLTTVQDRQYQAIIVRKLFKLSLATANTRYIDCLMRFDPDIFPLLLKVAKTTGDNDAIIKACRIIAGSSLYGQSATAELQAILNDKYIFTVKMAAMVALAQIGDKSAIPLIKKYTNDKNRLLAKAARQAMFLLQDMQLNLDSEFLRSMANFRQQH